MSSAGDQPTMACERPSAGGPSVVPIPLLEGVETKHLPPRQSLQPLCQRSWQTFAGPHIVRSRPSPSLVPPPDTASPRVLQVAILEAASPQLACKMPPPMPRDTPDTPDRSPRSKRLLGIAKKLFAWVGVWVLDGFTLHHDKSQLRGRTLKSSSNISHLGPSQIQIRVSSIGRLRWCALPCS